MSRIGKKPISVPAGVSVALDPSQRKIDVSGPKGSLSLTHRPEVTVAWDEDEKQVSCTVAEGKANDGQTKAYWGLTRSLINNMIEGVTKGYEIKLDVVGVGYTARLQGRNIVLKVGFANEITHAVPEGVDCQVSGSNITVSGIDKQAVGGFAAKVRATRKPEPYNGKGVRYLGEEVRRKEGKAFGS